VSNCSDPIDRVEFLFTAILSRPTQSGEREIVDRQHDAARKFYNDNPDAAAALLDFGQPELRQVDQPIEVAAAMIVASMLINLDEAITHE
jgi:hypothetical protein